MTRIYLLLLAMLSMLDACSPSRPGAELKNFCAIVQNTTDSPDDVTIRSALGGVYMTSAKKTIPAKGEAVWVLGRARPDMIEIESLALTTAYGPPDFGKGIAIKITYPTGVYEPQEWPKAPE